MVFPCHAALVPLSTQSTLCLQAAAKVCAVCARRASRPAQVVVARLSSVSGPRLQIRLARFDSGPRLQHTRITDSSVVRFFSSAHPSTLAAHSLRGLALAAGCCEGEGNGQHPVDPDGHPNSPTYGHVKLPHLS